MIIVDKDVLKVDNAHPAELTGDEFVDGGGVGYKGLKTADGHYVGRLADGSWHFDATSIGLWERCKVSGQIVTWSGAGNLTVRTWAEV